MNEEKENSQNTEFDENKGCGCSGGGCGCESPLADDGDEFADELENELENSCECVDYRQEIFCEFFRRILHGCAFFSLQTLFDIVKIGICAVKFIGYFI